MKHFLLVVIMFLVYTSVLYPQTGTTLYVSTDSTALKSGPGKLYNPIIQLQTGHALTEISRSGKWIEVGVHGSGGKIGWIHSDFASITRPKEIVRSIEIEPFQQFNQAFLTLTQNIKKSSGYTFFTKAEYLGDGIIEVTATDFWLSAPYKDRKSNLQTLFDLWDAADNSGLAIAVYIVDSNGTRRMSKKRP